MKQLVVAGRLDASTFTGQQSLELGMHFARETGTVRVYGDRIALDAEILTLAEELHRSHEAMTRRRTPARP